MYMRHNVAVNNFISHELQRLLHHFVARIVNRHLTTVHLQQNMQVRAHYTASFTAVAPLHNGKVVEECVVVCAPQAHHSLLPLHGLWLH